MQESLRLLLKSSRETHNITISISAKKHFLYNCHLRKRWTITLLSISKSCNAHWHGNMHRASYQNQLQQSWWSDKGHSKAVKTFPFLVGKWHIWSQSLCNRCLTKLIHHTFSNYKYHSIPPHQNHNQSSFKKKRKRKKKLKLRKQEIQLKTIEDEEHCHSCDCSCSHGGVHGRARASHWMQPSEILPITLCPIPRQWRHPHTRMLQWGLQPPEEHSHCGWKARCLPMHQGLGFSAAQDWWSCCLQSPSCMQSPNQRSHLQRHQLQSVSFFVCICSSYIFSFNL